MISLEKQNILPVTMKQKLLPAYNNIKYDNHQIDINTTNKKLYFGDRYNQAKGFELTIGIKNREILKVYNLCWNDILRGMFIDCGTKCLCRCLGYYRTCIVVSSGVLSDKMGNT